jgi:hypothetical protein
MSSDVLGVGPLAHLTVPIAGEEAMNPSRSTYWLIGIGLFAAVVIPLYWVLWFCVPEVIQVFPPGSPEYPAYATYEEAFLLADAWLALSALIGTIGMWKRREWGLLFMLLAGGSAIFLGLMDLLYDLQHAVFVPLTAEAAVELGIVAVVLGVGSTVIVLAWRHRRQFLRSQGSGTEQAV